MNETQRKRRGHNFMPPKTVLNKIPWIYATDGTPAEDKMIRLHYFWATGDCWVAELDPEDNEVYGYTKLAGYESGEWGYTSLEELEQVKGAGRVNGKVVMGLVIVERDCHWTPRKFSEIAEAH